MSDYLPQEVLIEILTRLPIKSLLKSRCVSKSWNSLITSPLFINAHLQRSTVLSQTEPLILLNHKLGYYRYSLYFDDEKFEKYLELEFSDQFDKCYYLVGSCNGVVCLLNDYGCFTSELIFWNPSIRKEVKLPDPSLSCAVKNIYMAVVGFGFDSRNNDYKVVRIVDVLKIKKNGEQVRRGKPRRSIKVELYSHNLGSWKIIDVSLGPFRMIFGEWQQALVNGVVHWIVCREVNGKNQNVLLCFDLSDELFEEMMLPECLASELIEKLFISVFEDSLAVFQYGVKGYNVWVMEEYNVVGSWTKRFSFQPQHFGPAIGFRKNGQVLIDFEGKLLTCDPRGGICVYLSVLGTGHSFCAESYVESLILLSKSNDTTLEEKPSMKRKERLLNSLQGMEAENGSLVTNNKDIVDSLDDIVETRNEEVVDPVFMDQDILDSPRSEGHIYFYDTPTASQQKPSDAFIPAFDASRFDESHTSPLKRASQQKPSDAVFLPFYASPFDESHTSPLKRELVDEMFSRFVEFESEISPTLVAPSAASSHANFSDEANKSSDIQVAWKRVTAALSTGPSILQNSQDVATLKAALRHLLSSGPQGKISGILMETIHSLEQGLDQLESKFKKAEEALAKTSTLRFKNEQNAKKFQESYDQFKQLKAKDEELNAEIVKLQGIQKENQEKMAKYLTIGKTCKESITRCQEELQQLSHAEEKAKKDKADVENTFTKLYFDLAAGAKSKKNRKD